MSDRPGTAATRAALDALHPSLAEGTRITLANAVRTWPAARLRRLVVGFAADFRRDVLVMDGDTAGLAAPRTGLEILESVKAHDRKRKEDGGGRTRFGRAQRR